MWTYLPKLLTKALRVWLQFSPTDSASDLALGFRYTLVSLAAGAGPTLPNLSCIDLPNTMDTDALSFSQREALSQLQALTNGGDTEVAIGVLDSCGWDVQVSAHPK